MAFILDRHDLKPGLILFRRADVKHKNWYCRSKLPGVDRYKVMSLDTDDFKKAREAAFERDMEICFQIKHNVPVFPKTFREVAAEYLELLRQRAANGEITEARWKAQASIVRAQLNRYLGHYRVAAIGETLWKGYPPWRRQNRIRQGPHEVSDDTIRNEIKLLRSILGYAVEMKYIDASVLIAIQRKVKLGKNRRDYFTPDEYQQLCVFSRNWIAQAKTGRSRYYRTVLHHFVQIMCQTGIRPVEAKNLRWQDMALHTDKKERTMIKLRVQGKGKMRELVAPMSVAHHLDCIRSISKATAPSDLVFTTQWGKPATSLYANPLELLLKSAGLLLDGQGKQRTAYCFRHTYATSRLSNRVSELMLSEQMGTSILMLKEHYGHVSVTENADLILQGMEGWE